MAAAYVGAIRAASPDRVWVSLRVKRPQNAGSQGGQDGYDRDDGQDHPERTRQPARKARRCGTPISGGPLAGLKLIGFAIWERRGATGRNVTFPARQYSVNGERRSFALLRPIVDTTAQNAIRDLVLEAFAEYEERAAATA